MEKKDLTYLAYLHTNKKYLEYFYIFVLEYS